MADDDAAASKVEGGVVGRREVRVLQNARGTVQRVGQGVICTHRPQGVQPSENKSCHTHRHSATQSASHTHTMPRPHTHSTSHTQFPSLTHSASYTQCLASHKHTASHTDCLAHTASNPFPQHVHGPPSHVQYALTMSANIDQAARSEGPPKLATTPIQVVTWNPMTVDKC